MKFSVALCTYNGAAFLDEQLDSLLAQSRLPDEIVIGDDGSTDGSFAKLEAFVGRAAVPGVAVRLFRQPQNVGYVRNFSDALRRTTGEVVFLCDQDDRWRADKLATMEARFIDEPDLLLLCSDARLIDGQGRSLGASQFDALELEAAEKRAVHEGRAIDVLLRRSMVTGATAAIRRALLDHALPVGAGWIHDEWLAIVAAATGRVDVIEQPLIDYRQHSANQIGIRVRTLADRWRDLVRPRGEQFREEVARLRVLETHLRAFGDRVAPDVLQRVDRRLRHFQARVTMGQHARWQRLPRVWREARNGNYQHFGTGPRSILRDLLRHD